MKELAIKDDDRGQQHGLLVKTPNLSSSYKRDGIVKNDSSKKRHHS